MGNNDTPGRVVHLRDFLNWHFCRSEMIRENCEGLAKLFSTFNFKLVFY